MDALCYICKIRNGTTTMNCSIHRERKRCCNECLALLVNRTKCVEDGCNGAVSIRKVTRKFQPWRSESWDFYRQKLIEIGTLPAGFITVLILFLIVLLPILIPGFVASELNFDKDSLFFYCTIFVIAFGYIDFAVLLFGLAETKHQDIEKIPTFIFMMENYLLHFYVGIIIVNLLYLWSLTWNIVICKSILILITLSYIIVVFYLVYMYHSTIRNSLGRYLTTTRNNFIDYWMEEKIEEIFLEKDDNITLV